VTSYDERGELGETPVAPIDGTLQVTGDRVVILYSQDDSAFRVEYQVHAQVRQ
jgi:hypothetical protein